MKDTFAAILDYIFYGVADERIKVRTVRDLSELNQEIKLLESLPSEVQRKDRIMS